MNVQSTVGEMSLSSTWTGTGNIDPRNEYLDEVDIFEQGGATHIEHHRPHHRPFRKCPVNSRVFAGDVDID